MKGYRKGHNPIVNGLKGLGEGIGKGLEAMAEAAREEEIRQNIAREREADLREVVEDALRNYEKGVGRPYQLNSGPGPILSYSGSPALVWDPQHRGHLISCPEDCSIGHCLVCGMENYGFVYCGKHRP